MAKPQWILSPLGLMMMDSTEVCRFLVIALTWVHLPAYANGRVEVTRLTLYSAQFSPCFLPLEAAEKPTFALYKLRCHVCANYLFIFICTDRAS